MFGAINFYILVDIGVEGQSLKVGDTRIILLAVLHLNITLWSSTMLIPHDRFLANYTFDLFTTLKSFSHVQHQAKQWIIQIFMLTSIKEEILIFLYLGARLYIIYIYMFSCQKSFNTNLLLYNDFFLLCKHAGYIKFHNVHFP